jgi:hypothetical protein
MLSYCDTHYYVQLSNLYSQYLTCVGKAVIHSESSNRKLLEIKKILEGDEGNEGEQMVMYRFLYHYELQLLPSTSFYQIVKCS